MPDNGTSNHCNGLCSLKTHQLQAQVGGNKFAQGNCWLDIDFYTRGDNSSRRFSSFAWNWWKLPAFADSIKNEFEFWFSCRFKRRALLQKIISDCDRACSSTRCLIEIRVWSAQVFNNSSSLLPEVEASQHSKNNFVSERDTIHCFICIEKRLRLRPIKLNTFIPHFILLNRDAFEPLSFVCGEAKIILHKRIFLLISRRNLIKMHFSKVG